MAETKSTTAAGSAPSVAAILATYRPDVASLAAARDWYRVGGSTAARLGRTYGVSKSTAAGVIAALSPLQTWKGNVGAAERILSAMAAGETSPPKVGLGRNVAKAWRIASGERPLSVLSGDKVRRFYRNLMGDLSAVTVDRWAARACGVPDTYPSTSARYARCEMAYREAAAVVDLAPAELQAIVWVAIRGAAE